MANLMIETDYTIVQRYQGILMGLYNYYCMAANVAKRMGSIRWFLETSLLKTLASKYKCRINEIVRMYKTTIDGYKAIQVAIERPDKKPLVAVFGGRSFGRNPNGMGVSDFLPQEAWFGPVTPRKEAVQRLLADRCELCDGEGPLQAHHIRKIADIDRTGRPPKERWERIMASRKRKTLMVCKECHGKIHAGKYDGPRI
jgi:hypothetical protein